jgi:hypothetical protein
LLEGISSSESFFKDAASANFEGIKDELRCKCGELQLIEDGLAAITLPASDSLHRVMLPFASRARAEIGTIQTNVDSAQEAVSKMCKALLVDPSECNPFSLIGAFLQDLQRANVEIQNKLNEEQVRNTKINKPLTNTTRMQASKIRAILDTADDRDRNMVDGLLGALKK